MKNNRDRIERIESALLASRRAGGEPDAGAPWQNDVMREIRALAPEPAAAWLPLFDAAVWRAAPVMAALALILLAYSFQTGLYADRQLIQLVFIEPTDLLALPWCGF